MTGWLRGATILLAFAFVWVYLSALAETARVQFVRPPSFVPEQVTVTYYVRVPRHEENRLLVVAAFDADERVSYMERELSGAHSPAVWNVNWRLPVGELLLVAAVFDGQRQVGRDVHRLTVYSTGP